MKSINIETLVKKLGREFARENFNLFLKYCDISKEYFHEIIDSWRFSHLWTKGNNKWILKCSIWSN